MSEEEATGATGKTSDAVEITFQLGTQIFQQLLRSYARIIQILYIDQLIRTYFLVIYIC